MTTWLLAFLDLWRTLGKSLVYLICSILIAGNGWSMCLDPGRADIWGDGFNFSFITPYHKDSSGDFMLIAGGNYTFGAVAVVTAPTKHMMPPAPGVFAEKPRPVHATPSPPDYDSGPSVACLLDGNFLGWDQQSFTAPATANVSIDLKIEPRWLPWSGSGCPPEILPGNYNSALLRTYKFSIGAVGFSTDHPLHKYVSSDAPGTAIDQPDGTSFVWNAASGINLPIAYTRGDIPKVWARIDVTPAAAGHFDNLWFRIKLGTSIVSGPWSETVTGSSHTIAARDLNFTETTVGKKLHTLSWEVSADSQNWVAIGDSGPHTIYWTYANPILPAFQARLNGLTYEPLYDRALDHACAYANGESNAGTIYSDIAGGIGTYVLYIPSYSIDANRHPLGAYETGASCGDLTALGRGLLRSIGLPAKVLYLFGGSSYMFAYEYQTAGGKWVTAQFDRPAKDGITADRHYLYHAVYWPGGGAPYYDPSYGDSYQFWTALEMEPASLEQTTDSFWGIFFDIGVSNFTCPHPEP